MSSKRAEVIDLKRGEILKGDTKNPIDWNHINRAELTEFIRDNSEKSEWTREDDEGVMDFVAKGIKIFTDWITDFLQTDTEWEDNDWIGLEINGQPFDINVYTVEVVGERQLFNVCLYACGKVNGEWQTQGNTFYHLKTFEGAMVRGSNPVVADFLDNLEQVLTDFFGFDWSYDFDRNDGGLSIKIETWGLEEEEE